MESKSKKSKKSIANFKIPLKARRDSSEKEGEEESESFTSPLVNESIDEAPKSRGIATAESDKKPLKRKISETKAQHSVYGRNLEYPSDLNDLFQPYRCNLCSADLNSFKTEKAHYESKTHFKKVTNWLTEWSKTSGEPLPKVAKPFRDGPTGEGAFYCEVCDLKLTSSMHATQHFSGKRHKMVVAERGKPSGSGYYDKDGKWIRQKKVELSHSDGRFGIGESFIKRKEVKETSEVKEEEPTIAQPQSTIETNITSPKSSADATIAPHKPLVESPPKCTVESPPKATVESPLKPAVDSPKPTIEPPKVNLQSTFCDICKVTVSSPQQMASHLLGAKHAKKLKALGQPPYAEAGDTVLASLRKNLQADVSIYRTPSGSYYCKTCDISLNDEIIFKNHLESKRHAKNIKKSATAES